MTPEQLDQLEARVAALEGKKPESGKEGLSDRLQRERQERIQASSDARHADPDNKSRPTSKQRRDELTRRSTTLPGPQMNQPKKTTPQATNGNPVRVVVVDNGEFVFGNFLIEGALEAVE
jgi:hypothetical protein